MKKKNSIPSVPSVNTGWKVLRANIPKSILKKTARTSETLDETQLLSFKKKLVEEMSEGNYFITMENKNEKDKKISGGNPNAWGKQSSFINTKMEGSKTDLKLDFGPTLSEALQHKKENKVKKKSQTVRERKEEEEEKIEMSVEEMSEGKYFMTEENKNEKEKKIPGNKIYTKNNKIHNNDRYRNRRGDEKWMEKKSTQVWEKKVEENEERKENKCEIVKKKRKKWKRRK